MIAENLFDTEDRKVVHQKTDGDYLLSSTTADDLDVFVCAVFCTVKYLVLNKFFSQSKPWI